MMYCVLRIAYCILRTQYAVRGLPMLRINGVSKHYGDQHD